MNNSNCALWLLAGLLISPMAGCDETSSTDTDAGTQTDTASETETETDTETETETETESDIVTLTLRLYEVLSAEKVEGAYVTVDDDEQTSDAAGEVDFDIPSGAIYEARIEASAAPPHRIVGVVQDRNVTTSAGLISDSSLELLGSLLGVKWDDTKSILTVTVYSGSPHNRTLLGGAKVGVNTPYDVSLVRDINARIGYSPGDVTLGADGGTVVFVNAVAGELTPTITTQTDVVCSMQPPTLDVAPGSVVAVRYFCN